MGTLYSNTLIYFLLVVCWLGIVLLVFAEAWHVATRVKLGFLLVIVLALAILTLH